MGSIPTGPTLTESIDVSVAHVVKTGLRVLRDRPEIWLVGIVLSAFSLLPILINSEYTSLICLVTATGLCFYLLLNSSLTAYIYDHLQGEGASFRQAWDTGRIAFWRLLLALGLFGIVLITPFLCWVIGLTVVNQRVPFGFTYIIWVLLLNACLNLVTSPAAFITYYVVILRKNPVAASLGSVKLFFRNLLPVVAILLPFLVLGALNAVILNDNVEWKLQSIRYITSFILTILSFVPETVVLTTFCYFYTPEDRRPSPLEPQKKPASPLSTQYIEKRQRRYPCPCCGHKTLSERPPGTFLSCPVCDWIDDHNQFHDPSSIFGANMVTLNQARENYAVFGAASRESLPYVRKPAPEETQ